LQNHETIRPFSEAAKVSCRGRSRRLELALIDFGADHSFKQAVEKLKRHYDVEVCESTSRLDVYKHTESMRTADYALSGKPTSEAATIISEFDGGMVPTVKQKDPLFVGDQRKNKLYEWREARLALAYAKGEVDPIYSAKFGTPDEIGNMVKATVDRIGRGDRTKIHFVGDGAVWITEQVEDKFGDDAYYMLDFFHASEYVSAAAKCCSPEDVEQWSKTQKSNLKSGDTKTLFAALNSHTSQCTLKHDCPAFKCHEYLIKRTKQLDYKAAIEAGLPIGSGKIEGGIRSVLHERLKKSGSWWKAENAQKMMHLRTVVANKKLDAYGKDLRSGAIRPLS
jgi:hypothetical protein